MNDIKKILMERDGLTSVEADNSIDEAIEELHARLEDGDMESAYDVCMDMFGLEPDYLMDLL